MHLTNRLACAVVLCLTVALNAHADWYAYFGVIDVLQRVRLDAHCDPELWSLTGCCGQNMALVGKKMAIFSSSCHGAMMNSTDLCIPNKVSEIPIHGLQEAGEIYGLASDNETLVLKGVLEKAPKDEWSIILLDLKTMTAKASLDSPEAFLLANGRVLYFPPAENGNAYSCNLDGNDRRLESVIAKGQEHFGVRDAFICEGKLCVLMTGDDMISVTHASTDATAEPKEIVRVSGRFLCRVGRDVFYRSRKNDLCAVSLGEPTVIRTLANLYRSDLFTKMDTRTTAEQNDPNTEPRMAGGMNDIERAYPTPDGTKLLFFNAISAQLPMEFCAFDVPSKTWSEVSMVDCGGLGNVFFVADPCEGDPVAPPISSAGTTQSR